MQGTYTLVMKDTAPADVFKCLKNEVLSLKKPYSYYEYLLENMNIDYANNDTIVTFLWDGEEDLQKHFAFKLQAKFAPDQDIHTNTLAEQADGTWETEIGVLTDNDFIISDKY